MVDEDEVEVCIRCSAELTNPVWLVLRTSTSTYHSIEEAEVAGWLDTDDDQGCFPFGSDCATKEIR